MDNYLKIIETKITKLTEINDTEYEDDSKMRKLIASTLNLTSKNFSLIILIINSKFL